MHVPSWVSLNVLSSFPTYCYYYRDSSSNRIRLDHVESRYIGSAQWIVTYSLVIPSLFNGPQCFGTFGSRRFFFISVCAPVLFLTECIKDSSKSWMTLLLFCYKFLSRKVWTAASFKTLFEIHLTLSLSVIYSFISIISGERRRNKGRGQKTFDFGIPFRFGALVVGRGVNQTSPVGTCCVCFLSLDGSI